MSDKHWPAHQDSAEALTPTNKQAATRAYCAKHFRAMLDIGGEKKCPACEAERKRAEKP
jgi:hypothetical protein